MILFVNIWIGILQITKQNTKKSQNGVWLELRWSVGIFLNQSPKSEGLSSKWDGLSNSFAIPASTTRTLSQSMTVGILWAMLIIVQALKSSRMIFWITASVCESTEAVASSINRSLLRFSITLPKQRSCLCPTLQLSPLSTTGESNFSGLKTPLLSVGSDRGSSKFHHLNIVQWGQCCFSQFLQKNWFLRNDPKARSKIMKPEPGYVNAVNDYSSSCRLHQTEENLNKCWFSTSSTTNNTDLLSPLMLRVIPLSTRGVFGRYLTCKSSSSTLPWFGQSEGGTKSLFRHSASDGMHENCFNLSTETILFSTKQLTKTDQNSTLLRDKPYDNDKPTFSGLMMLLGKIIMNIAETQRSKLPSSSSRNPNHSLDPLLWKSIRRLASTRLTFSWLNISCFLKQRIVITPEMLSEKWWITGAFVIESSRVNSRDVAR